MTTFKAKHRRSGEVVEFSHFHNGFEDIYTSQKTGTSYHELGFNQLYTRLDEPEVVTEEQKHLNRTMNDLKDNLSLSMSKPSFPATLVGSSVMKIGLMESDRLSLRSFSLLQTLCWAGIYQSYWDRV